MASALAPNPEGDVECFDLDGEPANVAELRRELQKFMTKFKVSAQLKKRQVEVTWSMSVDREVARAALLQILQLSPAQAGGYPVREAAMRPRAAQGPADLELSLKILEGKAGLDLQPEPFRGMRVKKVADEPGQHLIEGDLIIRIGQASLALPVADIGKVFKSQFRDGARLTVQRQ